MKIAVARISGRIFLIEFWAAKVFLTCILLKSFQICLVQKNENVIFRAIFIPFNKVLIDGLSCYFHEREIYLLQYFS
jgi:thiol-disulfide isomerase/thioredoxin